MLPRTGGGASSARHRAGGRPSPREVAASPRGATTPLLASNPEAIGAIPAAGRTLLTLPPSAIYAIRSICTNTPLRPS